MYEQYFGFEEKPFSLTPDPKYLYRSESHANAFELLQYALDRREGFIVISGDIGTGKTTLCRALLDQTDKKTFTALLLNPFLSEEDLLKTVLRDLGVLSRDDERRMVRQPSKQDLVNTLHDFLLSLVPLGARAVLIIDEAQNLPLPILEQIRILSNLETDKDKLLQIVLAGQLNLLPLLRSPELRQLDQRITIRCQLEPLSEEEVAAYITHRLTVAKPARPVTFAGGAVGLVHKYSGGIPRLINMLCDRALLNAYSAQTARVDRKMVRAAAESLELKSPHAQRRSWFGRLLWSAAR
jgi:general secretion pathway protein A